jgi:hypothetical protein
MLGSASVIQTLLAVPKSVCRKLRCPSSLTAGFGKITACSEAKAVENHVFVGSEDSRDSVELNQTLTNHVNLGFLGRLWSDLHFKLASTLIIRRAPRPVLYYS